MRKNVFTRLTLALILIVTFQTAVSSAFAANAYAADKTTAYRVYQKSTALIEFTDLNKAIGYAKGFKYSHVEQIASKAWVWNNFPSYKVYQKGISSEIMEYSSKSAALAAAKKLSYASVRDLQSGGWIYNNYPLYAVYQGDNTRDAWQFADLSSAKKEAAKWGNAHIIELSTNRWVWDNLTAAQKAAARKGPLVYQIYQNEVTKDEWQYAYLEDAVKEAIRWGNSTIVNHAKSDAVVYTNAKRFGVYQNDKALKDFASVDQAIGYAKSFAHARIVLEGQEIWTNTPYYQIRQSNRVIGEFNTIAAALSFANGYDNTIISTYDGIVLSDRTKVLRILAWNGSSNTKTILNQVSQTSGLNTDSPSWFELKDAAGNLTDLSDAALVQQLKAQNIEITPLVHNQFDSKLTTQFLASPQAQANFISQLVSRCAALGVNGINIDFESLAGSDRAAYTAFVKQLTQAAHAVKLTVSIDVPRGDISWDALTAYDREQLGQIVDYMMIMTYDQYYSGSPTPGSVAGISWVEEGVKQALAYGVPRSKIMLGMPFYVRDWTLDASGAIVKDASGKASTRALYMGDLPSLIASTNAVKTWDAEFQQYKVTYQQDGYTHVFWLEDTTTVKARIQIAKKYDLAGVAIWRLGFESADLWNSIVRLK